VTGCCDCLCTGANRVKVCCDYLFTGFDRVKCAESVGLQGQTE